MSEGHPNSIWLREESGNMTKSRASIHPSFLWQLRHSGLHQKRWGHWWKYRRSDRFQLLQYLLLRSVLLSILKGFGTRLGQPSFQWDNIGPRTILLDEEIPSQLAFIKYFFTNQVTDLTMIIHKSSVLFLDMNNQTKVAFWMFHLKKTTCLKEQKRNDMLCRVFHFELTAFTLDG